MRELLARWWAHRKLWRGRCEWCTKPLPDTGSVASGYRACSDECATKAWESAAY